MVASSTSIRSYRDLLNSGKCSKQKYLLLRAMREGVSYSRRELSRLTGLEINAVCGRVKEMLDEGALVKALERKDPETKQTVEAVALNTGAEQCGLYF